MRRRRADQRQILADPKFNNILVAKLINIVMLAGKKAIAEKLVYRTFDIISQKLQSDDPLALFQKAIDNARPNLELKSKRIGGATYQIPVEVKKERGVLIAMRWLRDAARTKKGRPFYEKLAAEIIDAYKNTGTVIKKREDTHKMAEANRAFAHYRW